MRSKNNFIRGSRRLLAIMQALSLCSALQLALLLAFARDVCGDDCLRRFSGAVDCGTVTEICTLDGVDFDTVAFPSDKYDRN